MPNNWKTYKLTELGTIARGKSKHRPRDASHLYGGEYPFIQTGDVKAANHRLFSHSQTYSEAGLNQSKLWPAGTMCITIAANIAETSILTYPACFPDSIIGFIPDENLCDIDFIEFMMQYFKKEVQSHSIGSVQDNINLGTFNRLEFLVPPLPEQTQIANILSAIDDKIENNLATNKTLEDMAMALYKHWFVDFGPFQDGEFVDSELGMIPKGWEVKRLGDLIDTLSKGTTPRMKDKGNLECSIPFIKVKDLNSKGEIDKSKIENIPESIHLKQLKRSILKTGDLLFSIAGTIGRVSIIPKSLDNSNCNQALAFIRLKDKSSLNTLVYNWLKSDLIQSEIESSIVQGVQANVSLTVLKELKIIIPNKIRIEEFSKKANPIHNQILDNQAENQTLTRLRDTLLPKLISGEVRLKEFREQVENLV